MTTDSVDHAECGGREHTVAGAQYRRNAPSISMNEMVDKKATFRAEQGPISEGD